MANARATAKRIVTARTLRQYDDALSFVLAEKDRAIDQLAQQIRLEVVLPACVRYGLTYRAGNGTYAFGDPRISDYNHRRYAIGTAKNACDAGLPGLADVFRVLGMDCDTASRAEIGHFVDDVTEADVERARTESSQ